MHLPRNSRRGFRSTIPWRRVVCGRGCPSSVACGGSRSLSGIILFTCSSLSALEKRRWLLFVHIELQSGLFVTLVLTGYLGSRLPGGVMMIICVGKYVLSVPSFFADHHYNWI